MMSIAPTRIIIIAALARNRVIGSGSKIPWRLSEDFARFKALTMGHPCIMGDRTFESLPDSSRPLPGRENLVLTFDKEYRPRGAAAFFSLDDAIAHCRNKGAPRVFITGGTSVYRQALPISHTLELTVIHEEYDGDVLFPEIDEREWRVACREDHRGRDRLSGKDVSFSYLTYRRRKGNDERVPGRN